MPRLTKATAIVVAPVLFAAFVVLFGFPSRTQELWAWTIASEMTALTIGAGYLGGVWFFVRIIAGAERHQIVGGLAAAAVFTVLLGIATIVHWALFNHDHVSFWAWLLLYTAAPFLLTVLAVANRRSSAPSSDTEERIERPLRLGLVITGGILVVAALVWTVAPEVGVDIWPWPMTHLTMRTIAAFVAFTGLFLLWSLADDRWSALRIGIESVTVGLSATAVGALRGRAELDRHTASTLVFAASLGMLIVVLVAMLSGAGRGRRSSA